MKALSELGVVRNGEGARDNSQRLLSKWISEETQLVEQAAQGLGKEWEREERGGEGRGGEERGQVNLLIQLHRQTDRQTGRQRPTN